MMQAGLATERGGRARGAGSGWAGAAVFYHIYPLGACGAPARNDFCSVPVPRLDTVTDSLWHLERLGVTALYLGPVFEATAHGYDTVDYYRVDRRLGDSETLIRLVRAAHARGIRVVLDAVFHHTGRDFFAFRDLVARGAESPFCDWYAGLDFNRPGPDGMPFSWQGWNGCLDLVKLAPECKAVREHLIGAALSWVDVFGIDGLRLDAADCLEQSFIRELADACRRARPDIWLLGEVVHGDYRRIAGPGLLDAVTNYECYKGFWSSCNDRNAFEIAYAFQRQSGADGLYRELDLYNFLDNHDVDRIASALADPRQLFPLHCLLFTAPGIPSVYCGSEYGLAGRKSAGDGALRPAGLAEDHRPHGSAPELARDIARLAALRRALPALAGGAYREIKVGATELVFARGEGADRVFVAVNFSDAWLQLAPGCFGAGDFIDALNNGDRFSGRAAISVPPFWARVLADA